MTHPRHDAVEPVARRRMVWVVVFVVVSIGLLYGLVPQLPGLRNDLSRLDEGDGAWLAVALACEVASFASYVLVFHTIFGCWQPGLGWAESYRITMAGVVATRLLAFGGAGGIALTAWALVRGGMDRERARVALSAFLIFVYSMFLAALVVAGILLRVGVLDGPDPFAFTIGPAIFAGCGIVVFLLLGLVPPDLQRRVDAGPGVRGRIAHGLATVPATISAGVRGALALLRTRRPGLLGAVGWWAFDIGALWACLRAFDGDVSVGVTVMAYFLGLLGNLLPIPGGIGGVEGGMIGALLAFDVSGGVAVLGVLAYRAISFWLPIVPGLLAYLRLVHDLRVREPA